MGTRHIVQVIKDGETKVSQYGQYDGYPECKGAMVLEFLKTMDRTVFELKVGHCIYPSAESLEGATVTEYPTLARSMSAEILQHIQDSTEPVPLLLDLDFMYDSLFCEWVYVIDLDNNKLEVYTGFNHSPVPPTNRFQLDEGEVVKPAYEGAETYYPVVLVKEYDLDNLPTESVFIRECDPPEDEEEQLSQEDVFLGVVDVLREMTTTSSQQDVMLDHMLNYLKANKEDFLEAIED